MEEEINRLKLVLRSLVVSSSSKVDVRTLMKDYQNMVGSRLPINKFGYREPISFLKEQCSDSFMLRGPASNPVLELITPETLEHIDKFVQRQRKSAVVKLKGKRTSVAETYVQPAKENLVSKSFMSKKEKERKSVPENKQNIGNEKEKINKFVNNSSQNHTPKQEDGAATQLPNGSGDDNHIAESQCHQSILHNFLKKRTALYSCSQSVSDPGEKEDNDSGRLSLSSSSSSKKMKLEELKKEIMLIITDYPDGVWCTDLLKLYRERFKRELNYSRFGFTSVLSLACALPGVRSARQPGGDWLLSDAAAPPPAPRAPPPPAPRAPRALADPEDALPGIDFDEDVFPADCLHFLEGVPAPRAREAPGDMVEVVVAEVYSPSHFWLQRLGPEDNLAMEQVMDEMNEYYKRGEGRERTLAPGAVRVGHYCAACYEGDWHRSIIVQLIDSDTVKVRHVDYGTVERCAAAALRPLRREWAALPAQARRARLAAARPAGRRWPRAAALAFLRLVRARRLVANVVAVDAARAELEVLLIDTAGADDRCLAAELVRAGHALPRADPALHTAECYLFPSFPALEAGATPSLAELLALQQRGLAPDCVPAFRRHVPPLLPADDSAPSDPDSAPDSAPASPAPPSDPDSASASPTPPSDLAVADVSCDTEVPDHSPTCVSRPTFLTHTPPLLKSEHRFTPRCNPPPRRKQNCPPVYPPAPVFTPPGPHFGYVPPPAPLFVPNTMEPSRPFMYVPQGPVAYGAGAARGVSLSAADCEAFTLLSRVDPAAAQRFMLEAISRAAHPPGPAPRPTPLYPPGLEPRPPRPPGPPRPPPARPLNPDAAVFNMVPAGTQTDGTAAVSFAVSPPPGFF